jgi:hypothetical protein
LAAFHVTALGTVRPAVGDAISDFFGPGAAPSPELVSAALIEGLTESDDPFVLVIDDYQLVTAEPPAEVTGETREIIVGCIERKPGVGDPARLEPADDSDGLSVARRGRQQGQAGAVLESSIEQRAEASTLAMAPDRGRSPELGRDERRSG